MLNGPFSPWPSFSPREVDAAAGVIASNRVNYWTGQEGRSFEREFAEWSGTRHAVALANGTLALDLALVALGIGAGDEVIVTPRTFIASVSSVVLAGAVPVFADVDRDSGNITAESIDAVTTERTRAIIPVHLGGWPCDMPGICALANERGIKVVEDCAQAHGARIDGQSVGTFGQVGAWSFCQDKIITTGGEGGMVTTDDDGLWKLMWSFKDHGKDWDAVYTRAHPSGFRWLHERFGTNWRMLEVQAAIGRVQLGLMDKWVAARNTNSAAIRAALAPLSCVRVPEPASHIIHAHYRQYAYVVPKALAPGWDRDRIVAETVARGVPLFQGSCSEVYLEKAFEGTGWRPHERLPVARELGETSLMMLVHPTLTSDEIALTCEVLRDVLLTATR